MSLSTRTSIAWPPDIPPSENTDTLVLSFPSSRFIDLRPLKHLQSLDWGMAGHQTTTQTPSGTKSFPSLPSVERSNVAARFIHTVDSRVPEDPSSVHDEGIFRRLDNGDDLEIGNMLNPETGKIMLYEEIWRTIPVKGKGYVCLESTGKKDKTFLGRIGYHFQGIGIKEEAGSVREVNAKRCEFNNGNWEVLFSVGYGDMVPVIGIEEEHDNWKEGDEIEFEGRIWKVHDCGI